MALARRRTAVLASLALVAGAIVATGGAGVANAAVDPVAGGQSSGDSLFPNQGNSGYDVSHYDITMAVNVAVSTTANALATTTLPSATTTITAATTGAPLSSFSLDFQGLIVDSVTVNDVAATFSRIDTTTVPNAVTDVHKLIITPLVPVDGSFTTVVKYHGNPVIHNDTDGSAEGWNNTTDGATFVNQPVGAMTAFPNNNTPSDKATYTISVDAPSKLTSSNPTNPGLKDAAVVSNGELVSKTPSSDGTRTTWVWNESKPMASELSLISVGRYLTYESDIALASGRTIHEWTFIDPAISAVNQATTQATRLHLKLILDFLESKYGPYPGNSVGIVTDVVPGTINYALETQDRPFFPNSASRGTTTHELMHQWFGDNVAPADWNDIWLNEGPATISETQLPYEGSGSTTTSTVDSLYASWNGTPTNNSLWAVPVAAMTQANQLFGNPTYTRGAMALAALRTAIGDVNYETLMKQEQVQLGGTSRHTSEFIARAQALSGKDLTAFFQNWIYTTGKPSWPAKFNVSLTAPTAPVNPGDTVTYTLTSRNTGKVTQTGSVITVDLSDILDDATLGALPAGVTVDGNTLSWAVPSTALAATSTVQFPITLNADSTGSTLSATAGTSSATLGSTCFNCASSLVVGVAATNPSSVPTITGTPVVGQTLTAAPGTWATGTKFTYQWLVDNTPIPGATAATFVPGLYASGLPGLTVSVQVTGTKGIANSTVKTSDPTAIVTRAAQTGIVPTISGTPQAGKPLTVNPGTYPAGTYVTFQWFTTTAGGATTTVTSNNGGAGLSFTPSTLAQVGTTVSVAVTATRPGFTNVVTTSASTAPIAAGVFTATPTPTFAGAPKALAPFTAIPGLWEDGTTLAYAWSFNGTPITGATSANYTPTLAQVGGTLTVTVTGTKGGYPTTVKVSDASAAIAPASQVLTPTPLVSGTAQVGHELTLTPGTWDTGTSLSYQWLSDGVAIDGATGLTYTLSPATAGTVVTASVTSTRTGYATVTKTSVASDAVAPGDLAATSTPTITGTPQVGVELTADAGSWDAGTTFGYRWFANGDPIGDATASTFTPGAAQLGAAITVSVKGSKSGFTPITTTSLPTDDVAAGDLADTSTPTITGTAKVGVELTAVPGTWDDGSDLSYQWFADAEAIDGATESTYTPGPAKLGAVITVSVTGTKSGYTPITKLSDGTDAVLVGDLDTTPVPTITGDAKVGVLLTALPGTWDDGTVHSYQWSADGDQITGATTSEYTPTAGKLGTEITVSVTGTKDGLTPVTTTSDPTDAVGPGDLALTPVPTISGTPEVGTELTATAGTWDDDTVLTYKWFSDGDVITDATASKYTPVAGDVGGPISVKVTGTKDGYTTVSELSAETANVVAGTLTLTPTPSFTGTAKVGSTVTAVPGTWDSGTTLSYKWLRDGVAIANATDSTYTMVAADDAHGLSVTVKGTKPGFTSVTVTSASTTVAKGSLTLHPKPVLTGSAKVGNTLTVVADYDAGVTKAYAWYADGHKITASRHTLKLTKSVKGTHITVRVTATKPGYVTFSTLSAQTARVK